jgi:hypothetical protein
MHNSRKKKIGERKIPISGRIRRNIQKVKREKKRQKGNVY